MPQPMRLRPPMPCVCNMMDSSSSSSSTRRAKPTISLPCTFRVRRKIEERLPCPPSTGGISVKRSTKPSLPLIPRLSSCRLADCRKGSGSVQPLITTNRLYREGAGSNSLASGTLKRIESEPMCSCWPANSMNSPKRSWGARMTSLLLSLRAMRLLPIK